MRKIPRVVLPCRRGRSRGQLRRRNGTGSREARLGARACDLDDGVREPDLDRGAHARSRRATSTCRSAEVLRDARSCGSTPEGGANQAGVVVARVNPPCNTAGLAFGPDRRLYVTGFGAAGDEIGVVTPSDADPANPPVATGFATGTPGANGVAFDEDGNLYVSDGGTAQGRVFRVGPAGGAAAVLFRVPPMANSVGVGRQNQALQPPATPGDAGDRRERAGVRPARCALRRRHSPRRAVARRAEQATATSAHRRAATRRSRPTRSASTRSSSSILPRRRRRDRARPRRQHLGRPERAERNRRRRPTGRGLGVLPQSGRRGQPAERRPARVPDQPGPRRTEVLHDELGREPSGQLAEHRRRSKPGKRRSSGRSRASTRELDNPGEPLPVG